VLFDSAFNGSVIPNIPANTLCLTFDDGPSETGWPRSAPGPQSLEVAQYLASERVQATFFMVGSNLQQHPGMAARIGALGHQLGVHTYDHVALDDLLTNGGDVVRQMALTGALVPASVDVPIYFRAPFGQWTPQVAQAMNADFATCLSYFGPIGWDNYTATDWDKWLSGTDPASVANDYLSNINGVMGGRGVVLIHDNTAGWGALRIKNRGLALARILVPQLKAAGFNLVRLDSLAGLAAKAALPSGIALKHSSSGMHISPQGGGGGQVLVNGPAPSLWEKLTVVMLGSNRLALRASGGQYLSVQNSAGNPVSATADTIGDWEIFEAVPFPGGQMVFRGFTSGFLTVGAGTELTGTGGVNDNSKFSFFLYP
jgi:peptidoglycan/xylan/chitin deacetylase (PgdA/CDA1 family)